jgi:hypothetical protein
LPLRFEKQLGLVENPFSNRRRAIAPGGVQLPGLPGVAVMLDEHRSHALAIVQTDARHRHQKLHRQMGGDLALTHLLLDGLRQQFHQR